MKHGVVKPLKMLRRWRAHDRRDRYYLIAALGYLATSYVRYRLRSISSILADLQAAPETAVEDPAFDWRKAAWAIEAAAAYVPWRSDCLIRVMAATLWLRRKGYRPVFHLGVAQEGQAPLKAHAWLSLHGEVIVGGTDEDTAAFASFRASQRGNA